MESWTELQPIRRLLFVYGAHLNPKPREFGTALYCRVFISDYVFRDFKWDPGSLSWQRSDYLGRLLSRGEPDLENLEERELPAEIGWPEIY